jgi:hypothetical protein
MAAAPHYKKTRGLINVNALAVGGPIADLRPAMSNSLQHLGLPDNTPDGIAQRDLERVMRTVPLGAGVLAGGAVALLVLGWLIIYLLIFLPRGTVG